MSNTKRASSPLSPPSLTYRGFPVTVDVAGWFNARVHREQLRTETFVTMTAEIDAATERAPETRRKPVLVPLRILTPSGEILSGVYTGPNGNTREHVVELGGRLRDTSIGYGTMVLKPEVAREQVDELVEAIKAANKARDKVDVLKTKVVRTFGGLVPYLPHKGSPGFGEKMQEAQDKMVELLLPKTPPAATESEINRLRAIDVRQTIADSREP